MARGRHRRLEGQLPQIPPGSATVPGPRGVVGRPHLFTFCFKISWKILQPLKPKVPVCLWLKLCTMICWGAWLRAVIRGVTTRGKGHNFPGAESLWGCRITAGRRKVPTMSQVLQCSTFASERPQVRTWGAKFVSCPGRHLTFVTPLAVIQYTSESSMYMKCGVAQLHSKVIILWANRARSTHFVTSRQVVC